MLGVKKGVFATKITVILIIFIFSLIAYSNLGNSYAYNTTIIDNRDYVLLGGESIKLNIKTDGLIVLNDNNAFKTGDYIMAIDNVAINDNYKLLLTDKNTVDVTVKRNNKVYTTTVEASEVLATISRSEIIGNATITYINPDNMQYAAVAHNVISNISLNNNIGTINTNTIKGITKNTNTSVGRFESTIGNTLGTITNINEYGTYGTYNTVDNKDLIALGSFNDIHEGKAYIVTTLDNNEKAYYEINIDDITNTHSMQIAFTITDETLLAKTNGIIKGMSGSPIVQDGLLVGAVSHTVNGKPNHAYGLTIENMTNYTK